VGSVELQAAAARAGVDGGADAQIAVDVDTDRGDPASSPEDSAASFASEASSYEATYELPRDRFHKPIGDRLVSTRLRSASERYLLAVGALEGSVRESLQGLCDDLVVEMRALSAAAHWALFYSTLYAHVGHASSNGWSLATLREPGASERTLQLDGLWPYWLRKGLATTNSFGLDGTWLLTAPNMAGKSSLMRSILVGALLANAGLMAPLESSSSVPRYDAYFLRTASFDLPAEGKSAFAQEMDDVEVMTSECSSYSLVMLDEIGRGTSSREGAALGVALLEWLEDKGMSAVFATHLFEIEALIGSLKGRPLDALRRMRLRQVSQVTHTSLSHKQESHTHTSLSLSHTSVSHTHVSLTHTSLTHTHKSLTHTEFCSCATLPF
jgi:DNA mismatch repair ATPase MutS